MRNYDSTIIENNVLKLECSYGITEEPYKPAYPIGQTNDKPCRNGMICLEDEKKHIPLPVGQASRLSTKSWERHLPHFQTSFDYYFITFVTHNRRPLIPFQKDYIYNSIRFLDGKKYILYAAVVLNDHVHIIIEPKEAISKIMHSIKSYTEHKINVRLNRNGKFWQNESMDKIIKSERELSEKLNYIIYNPIKAKLSQDYTDYKWLYVKG